MTLEEILAGESKTVEFKEALPEKSIKYMKTVVAFANGNGGKLIFGINDDSHEVVGIDDASIFKTMDAIVNAISDSCEPMIIPDISLQEVNGKAIIVVEIFSGRQRPYYIKSLGIRMGAKIEGLYREDVYEFPVGTVREMICNAVCHRSYLEPGNVQVALYDNKLEVTSPGMLLGGVSIKKMKEGYSKIRNRGITSAFSYMKIIEGWGSGIPRMIRECKDYGLKEPELIDLDGDFRINLYRVGLDTTQSNRLTNLDIAIINIIQNKPTATQSEIALELNWPLNRVKYYTKKLRGKGIIEHKGSNRSGVWEVREA